MNADTGHLVKLAKESLEELQGIGYEPVPEELTMAAEKKLAGKDEAYISLTSGGKLSKWAAKNRKERRKATKASRQKNRS